MNFMICRLKSWIPRLSVAEIRAKARKVKAEHKDLGLVIIDYLQLIRPTGIVTATGLCRWGYRSGTAGLGGRVGSAHHSPVSVESCGSPRQQTARMSDLRDSGNIEEFADVIMFLYREDYYYPDKAAAEGTQGLVEVIIAKQRKGQTGKAILRWVPEYTRFIDESFREEAEIGA